ncbi:MAG: hypothetical protein WCT16_04825 [Candidatus Buchananbacteria bacterium]
MPLEPLETKDWDLWYELTATPSEVPDLGHHKPQIKKKRLKIRLPGGRRKVLKDKRGGWMASRRKRLERSILRIDCQARRSALEKDQQRNIRDALVDAGKEIPSLLQSKRQFVFASFGGDDSEPLMY